MIDGINSYFTVDGTSDGARSNIRCFAGGLVVIALVGTILGGVGMCEEGLSSIFHNSGAVSITLVCSISALVTIPFLLWISKEGGPLSSAGLRRDIHTTISAIGAELGDVRAEFLALIEEANELVKEVDDYLRKDENPAPLLDTLVNGLVQQICPPVSAGNIFSEQDREYLKDALKDACDTGCQAAHQAFQNKKPQGNANTWEAITPHVVNAVPIAWLC